MKKTNRLEKMREEGSFNAFSLLEMMIVLLIIAIIAAASAPMVTKKMTRNTGGGGGDIWSYVGGMRNSIMYNPGSDHVIIGDNNGNNNRGLLYLNKPNNNGNNHIEFADNNTNVGHINFTNDRFEIANINNNNTNTIRFNADNSITISAANGSSVQLNNDGIVFDSNEGGNVVTLSAAGNKTLQLDGDVVKNGETIISYNEETGVYNIGRGADSVINLNGNVKMSQSLAVANRAFIGYNNGKDSPPYNALQTSYVNSSGGVSYGYVNYNEGNVTMSNSDTGKPGSSYSGNASEPNGRFFDLQDFLNRSDRRLKNVGDKFNGGLEELKKLDLYHFTFKKDEAKTPHVGVMAQDLQKVFPDAVKEGDDGYLRIRWDEMFFALINAVKELDNKVTAAFEQIKTNNDDVSKLKSQVDEQQKVITDLEKRLAKLEKKSKKSE